MIQPGASHHASIYRANQFLLDSRMRLGGTDAKYVRLVCTDYFSIDEKRGEKKERERERKKVG